MSRESNLDRLERILKHISKTSQVINDIKLSNSKFGYKIAQMHLIKLETSFYCALKLIKEGYYIEVISIFRLIFEQLCYSVNVLNMDEQEINKTSITKSIKCIAKINKEYPKIYGLLSSYVHFDAKAFINIIDLDKECPQGITIITKNYNMEFYEDDINNFCTILLLVQIYYKVIEYFVNASTKMAEEASLKITYDKKYVYKIMNNIRNLDKLGKKK